MTDLITEARELCEAATPGPWRTKDRGAYIEIHDNNTWAKALSPFAHVEGDESDNAAFIARSRTLIPELCDALEKAQTEIERLQAQLAEAQAREQAAVEHLTLRNTMERVPCISCKKSCVDSKDYYCRDWVYCGPQEAGKGASRGAK